MKKIISSILIAFPLLLHSAEKVPDKMTTKIIQVESIVNSDTAALASEINKFLTLRKIQRDDLIDIKFSSTEQTRRALIIYEVSYPRQDGTP